MSTKETIKEEHGDSDRVNKEGRRLKEEPC